MKELPNSIDSEKNLLAAMMLNGGEIVSEVATQLKAEDFYRTEHREIFKAILNAYNATTEPLNENLIINVLERTKARVDRAYFLGLLDCEFTTARAATYIKNIKETARLRKLIDISAVVQDKAFNGDTSAEVTAELEKLLLDADDPAPTNLESAGKIAVDVFNRVSQIKQGELTGITTGLIDLNKLTNGLQKSDLIFLAARPSMGKTALALNIALNAAKQKKSVAVFSLEMSKYQIGTRLLSSMTDIPVTAITSGTADRGQLIDAADGLNDLPLYIDDTSSMTVSAIRGKVQKFKRDHGLDMIIIDYVQLMVGDRAKGDNRVQEVSEISRSLKALAKYFNVPVLALSQLNRGVEIRADKRPQLSDLRESGSLEQDADIVMFLYRDDYYNRDDSDLPNIAELIIAKNRNGATGTVRLHFSAQTVLFTDLTTRVED